VNEGSLEHLARGRTDGVSSQSAKASQRALGSPGTGRLSLWLNLCDGMSNTVTGGLCTLIPPTNGYNISVSQSTRQEWRSYLRDSALYNYSKMYLPKCSLWSTRKGLREVGSFTPDRFATS